MSLQNLELHLLLLLYSQLESRVDLELLHESELDQLVMPLLKGIFVHEEVLFLEHSQLVEKKVFLLGNVFSLEERLGLGLLDLQLLDEDFEEVLECLVIDDLLLPKGLQKQVIELEERLLRLSVHRAEVDEVRQRNVVKEVSLLNREIKHDHFRDSLLLQVVVEDVLEEALSGVLAGEDLLDFRVEFLEWKEVELEVFLDFEPRLQIELELLKGHLLVCGRLGTFSHYK